MMAAYKITIEKINLGGTIGSPCFFFDNKLGELLDADYFDRPMYDYNKTLREYIKETLNIPDVTPQEIDRII